MPSSTSLSCSANAGYGIQACFDELALARGISPHDRRLVVPGDAGQQWQVADRVDHRPRGVADSLLALRKAVEDYTRPTPPRGIGLAGRTLSVTAQAGVTRRRAAHEMLMGISGFGGVDGDANKGVRRPREMRWRKSQLPLTFVKSFETVRISPKVERDKRLSGDVRIGVGRAAYQIFNLPAPPIARPRSAKICSAVLRNGHRTSRAKYEPDGENDNQSHLTLDQGGRHEISKLFSRSTVFLSERMHLIKKTCPVRLADVRGSRLNVCSSCHPGDAPMLGCWPGSFFMTSKRFGLGIG